MCFFKQRGYFVISKTCYAAANASHEEGEGRVLLGELDKLVHIRTDGFHTALHGGDGIALALQTYALAHDGSELAVGDISCTGRIQRSRSAPTM